VKAKFFFVAVNTQFKAAPLNSKALGKYINKVDQVDQLNREIEKIRLRRATPAAGFLKSPSRPKITTPKSHSFLLKTT
jgi:hypothetical protein